MSRMLWAALLLGVSACRSVASQDHLWVRLDCGKRAAETRLGDVIRLDLEEGYELLATSCASGTHRVRIAAVLLHDGRVIDEPEYDVDVNGQVEFTATLGPVRPVRLGCRGTCPLAAEFTAFESPTEARVRLSIRSAE